MGNMFSSVSRIAPTIKVKTDAGSSTYLTPPGVLYLRVRVVGGGAGGCGNGTTPAAPDPGEQSFFGTITADGGAIGTAATGGEGGSAAGGDINITGARGGHGTAQTNSMGGAGGGGFFGGGGAGGAPNATGRSAQPYSGGGGGGSGDGGTASSGGGGGAGGYAEKLITNPAASYNFHVAAGGAGSASGNVGGDGGQGIIIIEEYY